MNLEMFSLTRKQNKERKERSNTEMKDPASFPSSVVISMCSFLFIKHVIEN